MTRVLSPCLALFLSMVPLTLAGADSPVEAARASLARKNPREAVQLLEQALPEATKAELPELLATLRDAYAKAITVAEAEGRTKEKERYREGLSLLPRATAAEDKKPTPASAPAPAPIQLLPVAPVPNLVAEPPSDAPAETDPIPNPKVASPGARAEPKPLPPVGGPEPKAQVDPSRLMIDADRAWKEKRYADAGAIYADLAGAQKLPASRRDHWAYCRLVVVLERINAQPRTPQEWSEIHGEIDHIRLLSPKNWYSEYLRNVVVERSGGVKRASTQNVVLRGGSPDAGDLPPSSPRGAATRKDVLRAQSPEPRPSPRPVPPPQAQPAEVEVGRPGVPMGNWKRYVTPNFQIFHNDEALARKVAAKAEATRLAAIRRWTGAEPRGKWTPVCDIYLYPTAEIFSAETQQPPESPGFSTAGLSGGRVTARIVKLRADATKILEAVLPHEVTHIVLADLFPSQQIPRWADEGMAVLSEPESEQGLRANDLAGPLEKDVLFELDVLMTSDYPGGSHWALYYAQSVSLTRYLVGLDSAPKFAAFVKKSQTAGLDVALEDAYGIKGTADLEARWKAHARQAAQTATAAAAGDQGVIRR